MTNTPQDSGEGSVKEGMPVMCCHPAEEGGASTRSGEGQAPSTPRPWRQESRSKSRKKFFRCTPEQDSIIQTNAAEAGFGQSTYLLIQAVGKSKAGKCRHIRADWKELQRCMGVINKAGNVVNQFVVMLRRVGGHSDAADSAFAELAKAARAIVNALK